MSNISSLRIGKAGGSPGLEEALPAVATGRTFRSDLDESGMFGRGWTVVSAYESQVELEGPDGERSFFLDMMTAYGAVNFGHRNPSLVPPTLEVDLVGGLYPPDAETLSRWICRRTGLNDHEVLFQVGGSFAVSTALATR